MTSQLIRRFQVRGKFKGDRLIQTRETQRRELVNSMKDEGYVPLYDLDPVWEQSWEEEDVFSFTYTWQAVYVGEEKAWQTEGIYGGKEIPSTPRTK